MPAEECNNGKWKWGETGECEYDSQEEAEKDNEDYNETEEMMMILIQSYMKRIKIKMMMRK